MEYETITCENKDLGSQEQIEKKQQTQRRAEKPTIKE